MLDCHDGLDKAYNTCASPHMVHIDFDGANMIRITFWQTSSHAPNPLTFASAAHSKGSPTAVEVARASNLSRHGKSGSFTAFHATCSSASPFRAILTCRTVISPNV